MTTALPARTTPHDPSPSPAPRLHLVGDTARRGTQGPTPPPLVGYLVLVPEGTDPAELFVKDGPRPEIRPVSVEVSPPDRWVGDDAVRIDTARHVAEVDGRELDLTYLEFELLAHLVQHPHHVHSRDGLVGAVWGYDHVGDGRTVDVHIARLRRKLGEAHRHRIVTVRRMGYKYVPDQQESPDAALCGRP
ncbi:Putative regulatory protein [Streptomyces ambofaciens ATCC 23877]|nr:winged helix-turn-helix domain-containing protein [Streptomyces ambofaciens]AKZ60251.1 Putative regulatory protein [Streptomyces ambofaciens ATCC 23877]